MIVLLRGWMRDGRHWEAFPRELSRQLAKKAGQRSHDERQRLPQILAPDLPGNGSRYTERTPGNIEGMMEAIRS